MNNAVTIAIGLFLSLVCIILILAIFTLPRLKKEGVSKVIWALVFICAGLFFITLWILAVVVPFLFKLDNNNDLTSFWFVSTYILITVLVPIVTYQSGRIRGQKEALRLKEKDPYD